MTTTLGSYELGELLGRGSMGEVHRGIRIGSDDQIAVKVLRSELVADPEVLARFLQERSMLCSLVHPNLVRVHDLVVEGGSAAIVMDLVDGSDLRRMLNESGTLPPAVAAQFVVQILSALATVHAAGIVHRDIKPENVLVGSSGEVRLTDFGIARLTDGPSLTRMTGLIGTPEYLAPELAEHEHATPSADVYATGILFYELLTGFTPFAGGHPVAVLRRHIEDEPPRPVGVPDELWGLLASMLAKDPTDRPSAEEARRRLAAIAPDLAGLIALVPSRAQRDSDESPTAMKANRANGEERATILKGSKAAGTPGSGRRRATVIAAVAAVVLIAAAVGVVVANGPSGSAPTRSAVFAFKPQSFPSGLIVDRTWTLSGATGDRLEGAATLSNGNHATLLAKYYEVLPKPVASSVKRVSFSPPDEQVVQRDPVVLYGVALASGASEKLGFSVNIGPTDGNPSTRLRQLAEAQEAAEATYLASINQAAPATLKTLHISPSTLTLTAGQSQPVTLSGTMSDGTAATQAALAGVEWSTSAETIATEANGTVYGLSGGTATITAQAGTLNATVIVTVNAPAGQPSSSGGSASSPGSSHSSASGSTPSQSDTGANGATPTTGTSGGQASVAATTTSTSTTTSTTQPPTTVATPPAPAPIQIVPLVSSFPSVTVGEVSSLDAQCTGDVLVSNFASIAGGVGPYEATFSTSPPITFSPHYGAAILVNNAVLSFGNPVDGGDAVVTTTPGGESLENSQITVTVTDAAGATASVSFPWTISNPQGLTSCLNV